MIVSESRAKARMCPMSATRTPRPITCRAARCMAWVEVRLPGDEGRRGWGRCGLVLLDEDTRWPSAEDIAEDIL